MTGLRDISLGLTTVLLLVALGWSVVLRRRVREQTEIIRTQFERQAALQERYRDLFENANDMVFSLDPTGKITALNRSGEKVLGCSRERAKEMRLSEFMAPAQHEPYERWRERSGAGVAAPSCEFELLGSDGRRSVMEVNARLLQPDGQPAGIEGIARDITERKRAEEALRQSEERFSSAFRVSTVAIAITTLTDGRCLDANESFLRLFGFTREEVINRAATELNLWVDQEARLRVETTLRALQPISGMECRFRTKSAEIRTVLLFVEHIGWGETACALSITHDITERLRLEDHLRHAQKMEAVGRLAAGVAHDFNNLLTIIQGNTDLALADDKRNPADNRTLTRISEAAQRAANLTRQLLTFSRKQNPQPRPLDLNELINSSAKMFKHLITQDIILKFKFAADLLIIKADATMMEQVIMNLVVNARDAMPQGGELCITTSAVQIDADYVTRHPEATAGSFVCLSVADKGCGMDAATKSRIFEPFFTTKETGKGTGLGLATVYGIVQLHKGWIEVDSELHKGTTLNVFFPCEQATEESPKPTAARSSASRETTILVVEDEPAVCEFVRMVLQASGYRVLEAKDSLEALQAWNDNASRVDLLLTDIQMPHGMSGLDLATNLRALKPGLKVLFTSGYSPEVADGSGMLEENVNFLPKPYSPPKLVQMVKRVLSPDACAAAN